MTSFLIRLIIVVVIVLPQFARGDHALPGAAPLAAQAETVAEVSPAEETFTIFLTDPEEAPRDTRSTGQMMPDDFYLGDNCDYVAPVPTV